MEYDQKILESIELLDDAVISEKQKNLDLSISQKKKTDSELQEIRIALNWVEKLSDLIVESTKSEANFLLAKKCKDDHKDDFLKLDLANRALNISSIFGTHQQLQQTIDADKDSLLKLSQELEALDTEIKQKTKEYDEFSKEFVKESREYELETKKLKSARDIQTQEKQLNSHITKEKVALEKKEEELTKLTTALRLLIDAFKELQKKLDKENSYLLGNAQDEKLTANIGVIKETLTQYKAEQEVDERKKKELTEVDKLLEQEQIIFTQKKEESDGLSKLYLIKEAEYKALQESSADDTKREETLLSSLRDIEKLTETLSSHRKLSKRRTAELEISEQSILREKELHESHKALQEHIDTIEEHIKTLRVKKEQEQLLKKYEDDRSRLVEDEACFLCGSTNHPYAVKSITTAVDETEAIISKQLTVLQEKEGELRRVELELSKIESRRETSKLELQKIDEELEHLAALFKKYSFVVIEHSEEDLKGKAIVLKEQYDALKASSVKRTTLLNERDTLQSKFQKAQKELNKYSLLFQKYSQEKEQLYVTLTANNKKIEKLLLKLKSYWKEYSLEFDTELFDVHYQELIKREERYTNTLALLKELELEFNRSNVSKTENETKLAAIESETAALKKSIIALEVDAKGLLFKKIEILNVADLDEYEKSIVSHYKTVQEKEQLLKINLGELKVKVLERSDSKKVLILAIAEDEKKLEDLSIELTELYDKNSFKDVEKFKQALLDTDDREKLLTVCRNIEIEFTKTKTLKTEIEEKLLQHKKEPSSDKSKEELEISEVLLGQKTDALTENIGSIKKELEFNEESSIKHKERFLLLQKKKEAFKVWVKLNELVGSADGTKFKKFAQGITLDQLINLANQHLSILSARYTLSRSQDKLLELEIIDAYQGNVIRPVGTLSGGESFIVSLALALGLSELASQKIAIDSLFLDEGFGTLDEESLETALNALNLLQSGGKMVGVISHVEALKERIPLQIKVVPNGDGTSFVEM